jgi:hypothetical protein
LWNLLGSSLGVEPAWACRFRIETLNIVARRQLAEWIFTAGLLGLEL